MVDRSLKEDCVLEVKEELSAEMRHLQGEELPDKMEDSEQGIPHILSAGESVDMTFPLRCPLSSPGHV